MSFLSALVTFNRESFFILKEPFKKSQKRPTEWNVIGLADVCFQKTYLETYVFSVRSTKMLRSHTGIMRQKYEQDYST